MEDQVVHDDNQDMPAVEFTAAIQAVRDVWRRRWTIVMRFLTAGVLLAATYALLAEPQYTAWASLMIDPREDRSIDGPETPPLVMTADALIIDSEVKVLKSRAVTGRAVEKLNLADQTKRNRSKDVSVLKAIRGFLEGERPFSGNFEVTEQMFKEGLRRDFVESLEVERSGETYVIDIVYTASDPVTAAKSVNAVVEAYLEASANRKGAAFGQLNSWLGGRLQQLEDDVRTAEIAIAEYRRTNQIYEMSDNRLPSEVELSGATQQMIDLRSQIISLAVRIDKLTSQIEQGEIEAISLLENDRTIALEALEERFIVLLQQELSTIQQRGPSSPVAAGLREAQDQVRSLLLDEMRKIRDRLMSQQQTLESRITEAQQKVNMLRLAANTDAENLIELRRLERELAAKQKIFTDLLTSFNSSAELRSFDASPARVIAWAVPPNEKSAPQNKLLMALGAGGALILGLSYAFLLDGMDRTLRRPHEFTKLTRLPYLGVLPTFASDRKHMKRKRLRSAARTKRLLWYRDPASKLADLRFAADNSRSAMAETLSTLQVHMDWGAPNNLDKLSQEKRSRGLVFGLTSSVGGEGKSTASANLATFLAIQSNCVLLLDLDLSRRSLSRRLTSILPVQNSLEALLLHQDPTILSSSPELDNLTIVSNAGSEIISLTNPDDIAELAETLDLLRNRFDYVIVDMPPLLGSAGASMLGSLCDKLLLLYQWGTTDQAEVISGLQKIEPFSNRFIGFVFSHADLSAYLKYNPELVKGIYY